ncbi:MAG: hypothetical protein LC106_01965 [Burkholderiales bacterium]|nr:hypothetical protein [Burkholderiales bacterium]
MFRASRCTRVAALAALFYACTQLPAQAQQAQVQLPAQAQAGDIIFRQGTEAVSHLVRAIDQGTYSHVGLLVGQPGAWQVIHATPAERPGQRDAVVLDSLEFFLSPERARAFAVYRVTAGQAIQRQQAVTWAVAQQGRPFAVQEQGNSIYCTTLVWQAWQRTGLDWQAPFTAVDVPLFRGRYLLPSSLAASPRLKQLVFAEITQK